MKTDGSKDVLLYLIDTADKAALFGNGTIISQIAFEEELRDLVYHLVDLGLPKDCHEMTLVHHCFDQVEKVHDAVEYFKFFYETEPALKFDLDFFIDYCYDEDIIQYVLNNYIDPGTLTDDQLVEMAKGSGLYKPLLDEVEAKGRKIQYHKAFWHFFSYDDSDSMDDVYREHPEIEFDRQKLLEKAVKEGHENTFLWIMETFPESVHVNKKVMKLGVTNSMCCSSMKFLVAKTHIATCTTCSDLKFMLASSKPGRVLKSLINRH